MQSDCSHPKSFQPPAQSALSLAPPRESFRSPRSTPQCRSSVAGLSSTPDLSPSAVGERRKTEQSGQEKVRRLADDRKERDVQEDDKLVEEPSGMAIYTRWPYKPIERRFLSRYKSLRLYPDLRRGLSEVRSQTAALPRLNVFASINGFGIPPFLKAHESFRVTTGSTAPELSVSNAI
ncbi:hypothetical protein R3P38DRAFT_3185131 [Favolaschia claudopus]|uniref:Uncharacterized protein n=1 Tax=Favolaschia claudopus TaxID=2862362 RepID=A0AAW0C9D3_9AGAR